MNVLPSARLAAEGSEPGARSALPELLAPAGDFEAACAAFQYGADAVYAGLPRFSARAEAQNLESDRLEALIAHAHALAPRRRVYVALNTLVQDAEVPALLDALARLDDAGADAVIVQDLGVARLVRRSFPHLRLHASTQMAAHSVEGVRALAEFGFARVILARELTLDEIRAIARQGGVEVETFVHGALCYSYSGLCLCSSHLSGRSGNRGRCAYSCRESWAPVGQTPRAAGAPAYPLSMRDLCLAPVLEEWLRAGVASLKIEGRMKSALYVAAIVDFYRRKLDGRLDAAAERDIEQDIQTIFSRPWTTLYARGRDAAPDTIIDASAVGHRGACIGRVQAVLTNRDGSRWLRFTPSRALEKHDGLQIEPINGGQPSGFGIGPMRRAGAARLDVELPAGIPVEVMLPPEEPLQPVPGMMVYCSASQAVRRRYPVSLPREGGLKAVHAVDVSVTLDPHRVAVAAVSVPAHAGIPPVSCAHDEPADLAPARDPRGTAAAVHKAFERTGDTRWQVRSLQLANPHGLYVPPSRLNEIRRRVLEALTSAHDAAQAGRLAAISSSLGYDRLPAARSPGKIRWTLKTRLDTGFIPGAGDADDICLAIGHNSPAGIQSCLDSWLQRVPRTRLRLALPLIARDAEAGALEQTVANLVTDGWTRWECSSLAGVRLLRRLASGSPGFDLTADWPLYALNRVARAQLAEWGIARGVASPEDSRANLRALAAQSPPELEAIVFQHTPLFISETPPITRPTDGAGAIFVSDRRGNRLLSQRVDGLAVTVPESPFCLAGYARELAEMGIAWLRCDLSWSHGDAAACARWWREAREGRAVPGSQTGNYLRGLL